MPMTGKRKAKMTDKDIYLWRATIKTASQDGRAFEFCQQNNILGVGWCLRDSIDQPYVPASIEECEKLGREQYDSSRGFVVSIHALKEMAVDDLIWTRHNGIYYLCRVLSTWKYNCDAAHVYEDVINYVDVEFHEIGTVEMVPGKIVNSFRARSALQRITDDIQLRFSEHLYNAITGTQFYPECSIKKEEILDFLQPEDVEEAVSLYLQLEKGYLIYSSTNKLDTQTYELVAVAKDGSHKAYPQVKTGNVSLDGNDYKGLLSNGDKVFLFTVNGAYYNTSGMDIIDKKALIDFIYGHKSIMPGRIRQWL